MRLASILIGLVLSLLPIAAQAQEQVWVQIEAQPSQSEGEERARAYSGVFPNVAGFAMTTGWYAIVVGPYAPAEADRQLRVLKGERLIPADSYITFESRFTRQFWPGPGTAAAAPLPPTDGTDADVTALPEMILPDETPAEARQSEALLTAEERLELQAALRWDGFYQGAIDGAFGAGTRRSMATWQAAMGHEETGILTSAQRAALVEEYRREQAALGLQELVEAEAGIEVPYPSALVEFDRYEPPFVHFRERAGSGFRLLLISKPGDQATLSGLYDLIQTLEIIPVEGERQLGRNGFTIEARGDRLQSHTDVRLAGGFIKGFILVWKPADAERATRVVEAMQAGFKPLGDRALDEGLGQPLAVDRADLVSGLDVRRPALSRSGFWLDAAGLVASTTEAVADCKRVTVGDGHAAEVVLNDPGTGLAVLRPEAALAPRVHAVLTTTAPRIGADIAIPGYPYGDALDAAVMTFGTLADSRGLDGEETLDRLEVTARAGDAGAAVLDGSGAVVGMLLPRGDNGGRRLPDNVGLALDASALAGVLAGAGLLPASEADAEPSGPLAPEDLTRFGGDLAVIVSCWR